MCTVSQVKHTAFYDFLFCIKSDVFQIRTVEGIRQSSTNNYLVSICTKKRPTNKIMYNTLIYFTK